VALPRALPRLRARAARGAAPDRDDAPKRNEKNSGFLPEERAWFDALLAQGWVDVVRAHHPGVPGLYSWWSNRGRAREKDLGVKRAWIEKKAGLADHAPVWVEIEEGRA
jgi:exonuclease III